MFLNITNPGIIKPLINSTVLKSYLEANKFTINLSKPETTYKDFNVRNVIESGKTTPKARIEKKQQLSTPLFD